MKSKRRSNIIKELEQITEKVDAKESMFKIVIEPVVKLVSLFSLFSNCVFLHTAYLIALDNLQNTMLKIVVLISGLSIFSVYFISYSTLNYSVYFKSGKGNNLSFAKKSTWRKIMQALNLTFLAPI